MLLQKWFSPGDLSTDVGQLNLEATEQKNSTLLPAAPFCTPVYSAVAGSTSAPTPRLNPRPGSIPVMSQFPAQKNPSTESSTEDR